MEVAGGFFCAALRYHASDCCRGRERDNIFLRINNKADFIGLNFCFIRVFFSKERFTYKKIYFYYLKFSSQRMLIPCDHWSASLVDT